MAHFSKFCLIAIFQFSAIFMRFQKKKKGCRTGNLHFLCGFKRSSKKKKSSLRGPLLSTCFQAISKKKNERKEEKRSLSRNFCVLLRSFLRAFWQSTNIRRSSSKYNFWLTKSPISQIALWPTAKCCYGPQVKNYWFAVSCNEEFKMNIFLLVSLLYVFVVACLFSCHRTASDANCWIVCTLFTKESAPV